ncbi:MAG: thermonuclease family protein [Candidatus Omnitrophica bacterium]|nr:thermonuclease family protein [Candidatus Omnitrophota bacterium]
MTMLFTMLISSAANADMYFVQQVINGNTLRLITGETVRLIGVDIPEITADMSMTEKARVLKNQQKATEYVRGLVSGTKVDLKFDRSDRDENDNILAYVWFLYPEENVKKALEFEDDYKWAEIVEDWGEHQYVAFLNAALIKAGLAVPKDDQTNTEHSALFNSIYQQKIIPTMQAMGTSELDLTKVIP